MESGRRFWTGDGGFQKVGAPICLRPKAPEAVGTRRLLDDRKLSDFTEGLIAGVKEHQVQIDAMISEVAENWRLDRMAAIDRNILRLGAYEMMFCREIPARVAINEALELAKRYSTAQSSRFVNGILDRVFTTDASRKAAEPEPAVDSTPEPPPTEA